MRNDFYPDEIVDKLLESGAVTPATKKVLTARLEKTAVLNPQFFNEDEFATLAAVCKRLLPQPDRALLIDLPGILDTQFLSPTGNGWRYAVMPEDTIAIRKGLAGIEELAVANYSLSFQLLQAFQQDEILLTIQEGNATTGAWSILNSSLFFEELLSHLVEIYYSHPVAKDEIGDVSFADAYGWKNFSIDKVTI